MKADGWPTDTFGVILADPPWPYQTWSEKATRSASHHYTTQSIEWIASLPVGELAAKDCLLFLWITYPKLNEVFGVVESWGFEFSTVAFTWIKTESRRPWIPRMGQGYWTRSNAEICILAKRGQPKRRAKDVEQVILAPLREHSRKPEDQYRRIERLADGPYCELFGRYPRPGWTTWGNERRPYQTTLEVAA